MNSGSWLFLLRLLPANSGDSFLKEGSSLSVFFQHQSDASLSLCNTKTQEHTLQLSFNEDLLIGRKVQSMDGLSCGRVEFQMAGWGVFWVYSLTQASQISVALGMDGTA